MHKPGSCILWLEFDRESLAMELYYWFGGKGRGRTVGSGLRVSRHSKSNSGGEKNERPIHRVLTRGRFEALTDVGKVVESYSARVTRFQAFGQTPPEIPHRNFLWHGKRHPNLLCIRAVDKFAGLFSEPKYVADRSGILLQGSIKILQNHCRGQRDRAKLVAILLSLLASAHAA